MNRNYIDAQYQVLDNRDARDPDVTIGQDDFAGVGPSRSGNPGVSGLLRLDDPGMALAARIRQNGMSLPQAAFIAAPAVWGASHGRTLTEMAVFAAVGAAVGVVAYELAAEQGWVV